LCDPIGAPKLLDESEMLMIKKGLRYGGIMAEREGFEPSVELYALHSLSRRAPSAYSAISPDIFRFMAEGVGFEPTELSLNGFQDRRHRPLGHPSPSAMVFKFNINYKIYQYIKQKNSL
jgi:hypothetical protein